MAGANKVVVTINGVSYPIRSVESPKYVRELAGELDSTVYELMQTGSLALNEALVLISMEYIDAHKKAERNLDNMRDQLAEYMEEADRMREKYEEAQKQCAEANKKYEAVKKELDGLQGQLSLG